MLAAVSNRILSKIIRVSVFPFPKEKKKRGFKGVGVTHIQISAMYLFQE